MQSGATVFPATSRYPLRALLSLLALTMLIVMVGLLRPRFTSPPPTLPSEATWADLVRQDGQLLRKSNRVPFTGLIVDHYGDGTMKSRSAVSNGLLHGLSEGYYPNGHVEVREQFEAGVSHGRRTKWLLDGTKLSEAEIVDGKLHGTFRRWHPNGFLAEEIQMRDGRPDGPSRAYHPNGQLKAQATLDNGHLLTRSYWPEGEAQAPPASTSPKP